MFLSHRTGLLALLICVLQVLFAGLGGLAGGHDGRVGVAYNATDAWEYASFVEQARRGTLFMSNLFTTDAHLHAFFNPYFVVAGWFAALTGLNALAALAVLALAAGPLLVLCVWLISRELAVDRGTTALAAALVVFGTGPSLFLRALALLPGLHGLRGIDSFYYDLFPATALVIMPYHAVCWVLIAATVALIVRTLRVTISRPADPIVLLAGAAIAALALVRPYQGGVLALLFPASLMARDAWRPGPWRHRIGGYAMAVVPMVPALAYEGWMSRQEIWRDVAKSYRMIDVSTPEIVLGFALFWLLAGFGIARCVRERNIALLPFCLWTIAVALAAFVVGPPMSKFADGSVLAFGILGAYGISPVLARGGNPAIGIRVLLYVLFGTTLYDYGAILRAGVPRLDPEIAEAGRYLAQTNPRGAAFVLTDCETGNALPAYSGARVYAGQWAMTPDYLARCGALQAAGLGPAPDGADGAAALGHLLQSLHPDYVLAAAAKPAPAPASEPALWSASGWLSRAQENRVVWQGRRWTLFCRDACAGQGAASGR